MIRKPVFHFTRRRLVAAVLFLVAMLTAALVAGPFGGMLVLAGYMAREITD